MKKNILAISLALSFLFTTCLTSFSYCEGQFTAKPLPYDYDALQPYISKEIMTIHHDKHYQTYVDNLNKALSNYPKYKNLTLEELLANLEDLPTEISKTIQNNGGGVYNHEFFFDIMTPQKSNVSGELKKAIDRDFGSYDNFISEFKKAAVGVFGSGWAWLVSDKYGTLSIITTANQDSPITLCFIPIIGIDVWEHAYYLQYKNKRADYVDNWINVINWDKALENYTAKNK